ncbi:TetR/AcrR family transcriptional regulator [Marinimicrobium locisalis]|uniref:TetR/AcrR family transcriptional regulator n=1 Tax=Marinimicrobium locisalis TaxID=546022 RepID=UPI003221F60D
MAPSHKQPYHHGNLRQALLDSALETLEAEGLEKLSLRGLAKSVGVSPTAVYGHFADKTELLIALHTGGFKVLRETLEHELEALPATAGGEDRVRALGLAYMQFARERPHLFDAMFFWTPDFSRVTPEQLQEGVGSERLLRDTLIDMLKEEGVQLNAAQAAVASFSAWALVHGISTLVRSGAVEGAVHCEKWPEDFSSFHPHSRQEQVIRQILDIQLAGLKASAQLLNQPD